MAAMHTLIPGNDDDMQTIMDSYNGITAQFAAGNWPD